jgi:hypothetical protein
MNATDITLGDVILCIALFLGSAYMLCGIGVNTLRWMRRKRW